MVKFFNVLRELSVRYRQEDGSEVSPSTMIGYIRSLNRSLSFKNYKINLFEYPVVKDRNDGLIPVHDNPFAKQQYAGGTVKHHNTLPRKYLIHILNHEICDDRTLLGYVYVYIIFFGIALGFRTNTMWEITTEKMNRTNLDDKNVYIYRERNGSITAGSRTRNCGIKYIIREPVQILLFDLDLLDGRLKFYKFYEHLGSIIPECDSNGLFPQINCNRTKPEEPLVTGSGLNDYMTNHGLRSSMTTLLVEVGHSDSSIIIRTGYSNATTFAR